MANGDKKNLVVGLIKGYDFEVLRPFVETLKKTGYDGDIVFFSSEVDPLTQNILTEFGVKLIPFNTKFPYFDNMSESKFNNEVRIRNLCVYCLRYFLTYLHLLKNIDRYDNVMHTDIRDVIFQKNPFDFQVGDEISCFVEREGFAIKDSPLTRMEIEKGFGKDALANIADKPIICSGVTIGPASAMLKYYETFLDVIVSRDVPADLRGMDQGIHNYTIHNGLVSAKLHNNNNGPVLTLGLEDKVIYKNGLIYNLNGQVPNIVHQYDRHWRIAKKYYSWKFIARCHWTLWKLRYKRVKGWFGL